MCWVVQESAVLRALPMGPDRQPLGSFLPLTLNEAAGYQVELDLTPRELDIGPDYSTGRCIDEFGSCCCLAWSQHY